MISKFLGCFQTLTYLTQFIYCSKKTVVQISGAPPPPTFGYYLWMSPHSGGASNKNQGPGDHAAFLFARIYNEM